MKTFKAYFIFGLFICLSLQAQENGFLDLGNGACIISIHKDGFRAASFNDNWSINSTIEGMTEQLANLINSKKYFDKDLNIKSIDLGIHCGGYGSSIVGVVSTNQGEFCLWAKPYGNNFEVRSFGSLESGLKTQNDLCSGRKWGELILGISDESVLIELKNDYWKKYIKNIQSISKGSYKITLNEIYHLHEDEFKKNVLKEFSNNQIRYIEFNEYRHPIGEFFKIND